MINVAAPAPLRGSAETRMTDALFAFRRQHLSDPVGDLGEGLLIADADGRHPCPFPGKGQGDRPNRSHGCRR